MVIKLKTSKIIKYFINKNRFSYSFNSYRIKIKYIHDCNMYKLNIHILNR